MKSENLVWDIIGHKNILAYLHNSIINNNVSQSYLFVGHKNLGKRTVVDEFIRSLVCENKNELEKKPCRICDCCRRVTAGSHPDVYKIDINVDEKTGKINKDIKIDQIRKLLGRLSHRTFLNSYKIAVIDNADMLSREAANALLKTLEEPTPKTVIILIAKSDNSLPDTINSRCQILRFFKVKDELIYDYLLAQGLSRLVAENLTRTAGGCPGIAINYFKNEQLYNDYKTQVEKLINILTESISGRISIVANIFGKRSTDFNEQINAAKSVLNIWKSVIRDIILIKTQNGEWIYNSFVKDKYPDISKKYDINRLHNFADNIDETSKLIFSNINPRLAFENLVINI